MYDMEAGTEGCPVDIKTRVWLCRMIEKMESQPEFSKKMEIVNVSGADADAEDKEQR